MNKIRLANGTIINATDVILEDGILKISTTEHTVEELAALFSNKENTSLITLMTVAEDETGYKVGFTSFAGITYDADGVKTVELFQPKDVTEERLASAEATAVLTYGMAKELEKQMTEAQLALCELYEGMEV